MGAFMIYKMVRQNLIGNKVVSLTTILFIADNIQDNGVSVQKPLRMSWTFFPGSTKTVPQFY